MTSVSSDTTIPPQDIDIWVDFWFNILGVNIVPADTKNKKTYVEWKRWQTDPIPESLFEEWRRTHAFDKGVAIIVGKVWRGKNVGKYLTFIDLDNQLAIDEFCTRNGKKASLKDDIAEKFIVEQHADNPSKCHIYFYSEIPFIQKSSDASKPGFDPERLPAFEVKGEGKHGLAYCTPSVHKSGVPYEVIGTSEPITLNSLQAHQMMHHINDICTKHNLQYLESRNGTRNSLTKVIIPTHELFQPDFRVYEGHNRHLQHLRACESVIKRNYYNMFQTNPEVLKKMCDEWNQIHCVPPIPQDEVDRQWEQAIDKVKEWIAVEEEERKELEVINEEMKEDHEQYQKEHQTKKERKQEERKNARLEGGKKKPEEVIPEERALELVKIFLQHRGDSDAQITWKDIEEWRKETHYSEGDWDTILDIYPAPRLLEFFSQGGLRNIHQYPLTKIKDLGVKYADKFVAVTGQVVGVSELKPSANTVKYKCLNCDALNDPLNKENRDEQTIQPKKCWQCGEHDFNVIFQAPDDDEDKLWDVQGIVLQDGPLSLSCMISGTDRDVWRVHPGQKAYAFGVLKFEPFKHPKTNKVEFRKYIRLLCIHPLNNKDIIVTQQDIIRFRETMTKDPMFFQFLVDSFAPFIYGLEEQKELCIYTLGSQGIDRPNNSLLAGPPARAKTELVKYTIRLSHNGGYIAFSNTSVPGLTSATEVDADTGIRINKPGKFVMHAGGIVGLTELQAIKKKDDLKVSLNQAMEDKEVATAKAEGGYNLKANCAILIDSNNYAASWDYEARLAHNLQFMEPNLQAFLSRIDLISISPKIIDKKILREVARSNFRAYRDKTDPVEGHIEDWETENHEPRYGYNTLRKYFFYVTQQVPLPPLRADLEEKFADFYEEAMENNSEYLVDGRYNRQMALNARIRARLLLKEEADEEDLETARELLNRSKFVTTRTGVIDPTTGKEELDGNALHGVDSKKAIKRKESDDKQFLDAIVEVMASETLKSDGSKKRDYFEAQDVLWIFAKNKISGWGLYEVQRKLDSWLRAGRLLEKGAPGGGRYALV